MPFPYVQNASKLRRLHQELNLAFNSEGKGERWARALEQWRTAYPILSFPGGLEEGVERLRESDLTVINDVIEFLEADPYFFGSGYAKTNVLRWLKRNELHPNQHQRLQRLILESIEGKIHSSFKHYARLAGAIGDRDLIGEIQDRRGYADEFISRRAQHVIHVLRSRKKLGCDE